MPSDPSRRTPPRVYGITNDVMPEHLHAGRVDPREPLIMFDLARACQLPPGSMLMLWATAPKALVIIDNCTPNARTLLMTPQTLDEQVDKGYCSAVWHDPAGGLKFWESTVPNVWADKELIDARLAADLADAWYEHRRQADGESWE